MDDTDKRYSLVNPLSEGQRSRQRSEELMGRSSRPSEAGLFRPFDSQQGINGFEPAASDRDRKERYASTDNVVKSESPTKYESGALKRKYKESGDILSSPAGAFHTLNHRVESEGMSGGHSSKDNLSGAHGSQTNSVFSAPLNVPMYSTSLLASSMSCEPIMSTNVLRSSAQAAHSLTAHSPSRFDAQSGACVSKLDLEARRKSEPGTQRSCSDSECDSYSEPDGEERRLLISSGPPLKLDTSPKKIKLFSELGLTTYSQKKGKTLVIFFTSE